MRSGGPHGRKKAPEGTYTVGRQTGASCVAQACRPMRYGASAVSGAPCSEVDVDEAELQVEGQLHAVRQSYFILPPFLFDLPDCGVGIVLLDIRGDGGRYDGGRHRRCLAVYLFPVALAVELDVVVITLPWSSKIRFLQLQSVRKFPGKPSVSAFRLA